MHTVRPQIAVAIAHYVNELASQGVEVERVYLYGSHSTGNANEWSDVDVIVVSDDFERKPPWERAEVTGAARYRTFAATGESIEGLAKTTTEIGGCHPASFLADVLKHAVVAYDGERVLTGG